MSKSRVTLTPGQISDKWAKNAKASIPFIMQGIDSVQTSPMDKAADQQDKMLNNLTASITSGKWANALRGVSLADWKARTKAKIQAGYGAGIDASMNKRQEFDRWLVENLNSVLPAINDMPDLTFEDSVNRVTAYMRAMHERKYKS